MANSYEHIMNLKNTAEVHDNQSCKASLHDFTTNEPKINLIMTVLRENFYGCDILLCLFMAALQSYRVDRCLRPFPSLYIKESHKDVDKLRETCESLPSLEKIIKNPHICSSELIELLVWLFCQKDQPLLRKTDYSKVSLPSQIKKSFQPHYIYEVIYPQKAETNWQKRRGCRNTFLGYHGSQIDNFYSILKIGLQHHLGVAKEHLYGKGIYLTTEITISMPYAPFGHSWMNSALGNKHSIIAVCEVIDDLDKVKCKDAKFKERAVNQGSISGNIPDKYFVVTDSDMVRLKYLFVYKENTDSSVKCWAYNNMALLLIFVYVMFLFCIGFFQGPTWLRLQKQLYRMMRSE